jgi:nicotinamidase-related amidase
VTIMTASKSSSTGASAASATTTALIVIDVQAGQFPVYKETEFLQHLQQLVEKAHMAKVPVFFIQHNGRKGTKLDPQVPGWQLHPSLKVLAQDRVITKNFIDSFYQTMLLDDLKAKNITKLVLCGLQTECCVDTACRHAFSLGFKVIMAKDTHSTQDSEILKAELIIAHHEQIWDGRFAALKPESEIVFK